MTVCGQPGCGHERPCPVHGVPDPPVLIVQRRGCHFQAKPCALCGLPKSNRAHSPKKSATCPGRWPRGCATCGENKSATVHFGAPASFNVWSGTGAAGTQAFKGVKDIWERIFTEALKDSELPLGQERIYVEGEVTFPDAGDRDQGNFRVILEKALGDALERGGWLEKDDWTRYEFGALSMRVEPGVSETRLMLTPTRRRVVAGLPDQGQLAVDDDPSAGDTPGRLSLAEELEGLTQTNQEDS